MKLSDIRIYPINNEKNTKLKAFATAVVDDSLVINNMRVIDNGTRMFVAMPSTRLEDGRYIDLVFPTNQETRALIETSVIEAYRQKVGVK